MINDYMLLYFLDFTSHSLYDSEINRATLEEHPGISVSHQKSQQASLSFPNYPIKGPNFTSCAAIIDIIIMDKQSIY